LFARRTCGAKRLAADHRPVVINQYRAARADAPRGLSSASRSPEA
jgi:hypothetical protein